MTDPKVKTDPQLETKVLSTLAGVDLGTQSQTSTPDGVMHLHMYLKQVPAQKIIKQQ